MRSPVCLSVLSTRLNAWLTNWTNCLKPMSLFHSITAYIGQSIAETAKCPARQIRLRPVVLKRLRTICPISSYSTTSHIVVGCSYTTSVGTNEILSKFIPFFVSVRFLYDKNWWFWKTIKPFSFDPILVVDLVLVFVLVLFLFLFLYPAVKYEVTVWKLVYSQPSSNIPCSCVIVS